MMDRGTVRRHVAFHSKNKFEKLVHLIGFVIRSKTYRRVLPQCKLNNYSVFMNTIELFKMQRAVGLFLRSVSLTQRSVLTCEDVAVQCSISVTSVCQHSS